MIKIAEVMRVKEKYPDLIGLSDIMDTYQRHQIETLNWKDFDYKPDVNFSVAYNYDEILLKFRVRERFCKAEMTESNQNVYEDSCVEFFVSPFQDGIYYNMEFNALGTCLMGCGTGRADRERADPLVIEGIRRLSSEGNKPFPEKEGDFAWTLTIAIPFSVFYRHKITSLSGKKISANFYKCGDKLSQPHYLTWNPVETMKPDFHRPEYFGELKFIS
ncbi:MAG TPA: carbohydrate-binding family 9-like protein [Bacteroidales bacterium]|nr:carbohydrate-binding family 9-like protein [Bacteroidales bacterium]